MNAHDFTTIFSVEQSPEEVFTAINNVRAWWIGKFTGDPGRLGAEFTYQYGDMHRSTQKVTEYVPGKKIVWKVQDSYLSFLRDKDEWNGTEIIFEIVRRENSTDVRFTHKGLQPGIECFGTCSNAWGMLVNGNLRNLITTGKSQADVFSS